MVSTAWLLLSYFSCKATDLGIELPPVGLVAINQEDLKRDVYLGQKSMSVAEKTDWASNRFTDMELTVSETEYSLCGHKDGSGAQINVGVISDNSDEAIILVSSLISLSKAFVRSGRSRTFCIYYDRDYFSGLLLQQVNGTDFYFDGEKNLFSTKNPNTENVNYRQIEKNIKQLFNHLH